jgi:hypothetical protein
MNKRTSFFARRDRRAMADHVFRLVNRNYTCHRPFFDDYSISLKPRYVTCCAPQLGGPKLARLQVGEQLQRPVPLAGLGR